MDVFSHALWTAALKKVVTDKEGAVIKDKDVSTAWSAWWGVFPDLFAFVPMYFFALWDEYHALGTIFSPDGRSFVSFDTAWGLYQISHSFFTFLTVFGVTILVTWFVKGDVGWKKLIPYSMLGWPFHILLDIPTHKLRFFPTPFLWPISDYHFAYGFSWGEPWFLITDAVALIFMYTWLWKRKKRQASSGK